MRVEQTEFWADQMGLEKRAAEPAGGPTSADYFVHEDGQENSVCVADWDELPSEQKLEVSEPVEVLERRRARTVQLMRDEQEIAGPEEEGGRAFRLKPMETSAPARSTIVRRADTPRSEPGTRFNMTRMLTLTGSLDSSAGEDRLLQLPARAFRAILTMRDRCTVSKDFMKDLHSPPKNAWRPKF